jgi:hypothetical protein
MKDNVIIISGGRKNEQPSPQTQPEQEQTSFLGSTKLGQLQQWLNEPSNTGNELLRNLSRASQKGLETLDLPVNLLSSLGQATGVLKNNIPGPFQALREQVLEPALGKEHFQPQGEEGSWQKRGEESLDTLAQIATPFPGLGAAKPSVALMGTLGTQAAKEAGFGPLGQAIGGGLAGAGKSLAEFWTKTSPTQMARWASETYKQNYPIAENIAKQIEQPAEQLNKSLTDILDGFKGKLKGEHGYKAVSHDIKRILGDIKDNKANVNDMWQRRKQLDKLIIENISPKNILQKEALIDTRKAVNNFIKEAETAHPYFGEPFRLAEETWMLSKLPQNLRELLSKKSGQFENWQKNMPWTHLLLGSGLYGVGHIVGGPAALGVGAVGLTAKKALNLFNMAKNKPVIQQRIKDIAKQAAEGHTANVKGLLSKFNQDMENSRDKIEIISGGRND